MFSLASIGGDTVDVSPSTSEFVTVPTPAAGSPSCFTLWRPVEPEVLPGWWKTQGPGALPIDVRQAAVNAAGGADVALSGLFVFQLELVVTGELAMWQKVPQPTGTSGTKITAPKPSLSLTTNPVDGALFLTAASLSAIFSRLDGAQSLPSAPRALAAVEELAPTTLLTLLPPVPEANPASEIVGTSARLAGCVTQYSTSISNSKVETVSTLAPMPVLPGCPPNALTPSMCDAVPFTQVPAPQWAYPMPGGFAFGTGLRGPQLGSTKLANVTVDAADLLVLTPRADDAVHCTLPSAAAAAAKAAATSADMRVILVASIACGVLLLVGACLLGNTLWRRFKLHQAHGAKRRHHAHGAKRRHNTRGAKRRVAST